MSDSIVKSRFVRSENSATVLISANDCSAEAGIGIDMLVIDFLTRLVDFAEAVCIFWMIFFGVDELNAIDARRLKVAFEFRIIDVLGPIVWRLNDFVDGTSLLGVLIAENDIGFAGAVKIGESTIQLK